MTKRIPEFVAENRQNIQRLDSGFITISGQSSRNLTFNNNDFNIKSTVKVYKRQLSSSLISGHPNGSNHGSGHGVSGDKRTNWTLVAESSGTERFANSGRNIVANALAGEDGSYINFVKIGSDGGALSLTDTSLRSLDGTAFAWPKAGAESNESIAEGIFRFNQHGSEIAEYGVFTTDDRLYNRLITDTENVSKEDEIRLEITFSVSSDTTGDSALTEGGKEKVAETFRAINVRTGLNTLAVGSGSSTPTVSDTTLDSNVYQSTCNRNRSPEAVTAQFIVFENFPENQPVDLSEAGVFAPDGTLIWRTTFDPFEKTENNEVQVSTRFRIK